MMNKHILFTALLIGLSGGCVLESVFAPNDNVPKINIYDFDSPEFERALDQYRIQQGIVNIDTAFIEKDILTLQTTIVKSGDILNFKLFTSNLRNLKQPPVAGCFLLISPSNTSLTVAEFEQIELRFDLKPFKRRFGKYELPITLSVRWIFDDNVPPALAFYEGAQQSIHG